jgi:HEAT repeat protein
MKFLRILFIFAILFIITIMPLLSQDNDRVPTIEELYLEQPELALIQQYAITVDRDSNLLALDQIESMITENRMSGNEAIILSILNELAQSGTAHVNLENNRVINYFPMVRKKATELIGVLGNETGDEEVTQKAEIMLINILISDDEVMVKSEAAYALGVIGLNQHGAAVQAIAKEIRVRTAIAPDNNFAFAVILAIDKIAQAQEGLSDYEGYAALIDIMQGSYNRMVKEKALEVLNSMKDY